MIFKKFWKKAIIGSSIFTSVLATGLSTGLLTHDSTSEKNEKSNSIVNYHKEINKNTQQVKETIQKTPRSDFLKILGGFNNDKFLPKTVVITADPNNQIPNKNYSINNLSITEKNKIADLIYQIGSGTILINDIIKKTEIASHTDLNKLIAGTTTNLSNDPILELKNTKTYFLNNKDYNGQINYSNEDLEALAAFLDPNYLKHLKDRSTYLISYATILGVATAAAWGVAAYYWTCWWMFGANIPFAIAAKFQAGLMTADTGIAWADYIFNEEIIQKISSFQNTSIYQLFRDLIKRGITTTKILVFLHKNQKLLNIKNLKNKVLKFKNFIRDFKKKNSQTISSKKGIKSAIAGTSWASPVGVTVIMAISLVLNISNLIINFVWN